MDDKLLIYMTKMKFLKLDSYITIVQEESNYILKNIDYKYDSDVLLIPDFVNELANGCCSSIEIKKVRLGRGVTSVGTNCFSNCNNLEVIEVHHNQVDFILALRNSNSARVVILPQWGVKS